MTELTMNHEHTSPDSFFSDMYVSLHKEIVIENHFEMDYLGIKRVIFTIWTLKSDIYSYSK